MTTTQTTTRPSEHPVFASFSTTVTDLLDAQWTLAPDTEVGPFDDVFEDDPEADGPWGCECEQDWNCPMHGGTDRPTWIETRFSFSDIEADEVGW